MTTVGGQGLLLALSAAGFALGHLAYETGVRPSSPARFLPVSEKIFAKFALAFVAISWLSILLAESGRFSGGLLLLLLVAASLTLLAVTRGPFAARPRTRRSLAQLQHTDYSASVIVLLVSIWLVFYLPPFDVRLEARDPGTYLMTGQQLAVTGALTRTEADIQELDEELRRYLFPPPPGPKGRATDSYRLMGFYLEDAVSGRVVPQPLPLFPVWLAIGYLGGGLMGLQLVAPLFALLGTVTLFYFGRRLLHPAVGIGAALMLALNFVPAWFARYGAAETLSQTLVLIAAYGLLLQRRHGDPFFALLAGAAFGLTWLAKAEMLLLMLPLGLLLMADLLRQKPRRVTLLALWLPITALWLHALVHYRGWSWPYIDDLLITVGVSVATVSLAIMVGLGLLLMVAVGTWHWSDQRHQSMELFFQGGNRAGRLLRWAISFAIVVLMAYGYWIRPDFRLGNGDAYIVELGWAISPSALFLAVVGAVLYLHDRSVQRGSGAVYAVLVPVAALTLWRKMIVPHLLWAYRRQLPIVLPLSFLLACYVLWRAWDFGKAWIDKAQSRPETANSALVLRLALASTLLGIAVSIGWYELRMTRELQAHQELAGTQEILEELDEVIADDAVVLFEPRTKRGLLRLEAAIHFLLGRPVFRLPEPDVDARLLQQLVWTQIQKGRRVYLMTTGFLDYLPVPAATPVHGFFFRTGKLEEVGGRLPSAVSQLNIVGKIYELQAEGHREPLPGRLDIGGWDDLYLDGPSLHNTEGEPDGRSFRWTRDVSGFWLPGLDETASQVVLMLQRGAPLELGVQSVELSMDGFALGRVEPSGRWLEYVFDIPSDWQPSAEAPPHLELRTLGWRPRDTGDSTDDRLLGVKIDWIAWR